MDSVRRPALPAFRVQQPRQIFTMTTPEDSQPPSGAAYFGTDFVPPTVEELQLRLPQMEILSFIGHGGMGTYYRARHPQLNRISAIKILPYDRNLDAALIEGFKKEAKAMARLSHPNIIGIYELLETDSVLYLVMEYVDGDIFERLINTRYFDLEEILAIISQICSALNHAHENGVIHRDLRPGNTMLDQSGKIKVGDFGLARLMGEELFRRKMTETNLAMGTMDYVAPEQLEPGQAVDHRADIYSLGMLMYKLLTRILPMGTFVVPSKLVPNLDPRVDDLVVRCLQRNPDNRYQDITEVWTEVARLSEEPPADTSKPSGPKFNF